MLYLLAILYLTILAFRERRAWIERKNTPTLCYPSNAMPPAPPPQIQSQLSSSPLAVESFSLPAPSILPELSFQRSTSNSRSNQRRNGRSTIRAGSSAKRISPPIRRPKSRRQTSESRSPESASRQETNSTSTALFPELLAGPFAISTSGSHEQGTFSGRDEGATQEISPRGVLPEAKTPEFIDATRKIEGQP